MNNTDLEKFNDYVKSFRQWYIFWLEDLLWNEVHFVIESISKQPLFYDLAFVQSLYDALRIVNKAREQDRFPDLLVLDIDLSRGDELFLDLEETNPLAKRGIYKVDSAIKEPAELVKEIKGKNWPSAQELAKNLVEGGLYTWAIFRHSAQGYFNDENVVIYTGKDSIREKYKIIEYAALLTIIKKDQLFGEDSDHKLRSYQGQLTEYNNYVNKCKGNPPCEVILIVQNGQEQLNRVIKPSELYPLNKQGYLIESFTEGAKRLVIREFSPAELDSPKTINELSLIRIFKKLIGKKLTTLKGIDLHVTQNLLSWKGTWTIQIGSTYRRESVPFYLAPLGGRLDLDGKTISLSDEEEAKHTPLLATFFLPWSDALISNDESQVDEAVRAIWQQYGHLFKDALKLMREFCEPASFHDFIEASAIIKTEKDAKKALDHYEALKVSKVLSAETAKAIEQYLDTNNKKWKQNENWAEIKQRVALEIDDLIQFFQRRMKGFDGHVEIIDSAENSTRWYADVNWIKGVLQVALDNLTDKRAFKDSDRKAKVTITVDLMELSSTADLLETPDAPTALIIKIKDNGVGFNVDKDDNFIKGGGYKRFFNEEDEIQLLRAYGELIVESEGRKCDLGSKLRTDSPVAKGEGTLVTFKIYLD